MEPSLISLCGGGGGFARNASGRETFLKMAPTTLVACAASFELAFLSDQILYEVPRALSFLDLSSGLNGR